METEPITSAVDQAHTVAESACPACGSVSLREFFDVPEIPLNCIALWPSRETALQCPRVSMQLAACPDCGAVHNMAFDPARLAYDGQYDNSLHFSPTFRKYADESARYLATRYGLHGKDIIDVGCGNGEFLVLLCELGRNRGVGFDPAFIAGRADLAAGQGVEIVTDYYSERYSGYAADLVICRQVLEHIPAPVPFLRSIRAAIAGRPNTAVFFEVPNASFVFTDQGAWDIIYEHCFYYSAGALAHLFASCGFDVLNVFQSFAGQYLCLEAQPSTGKKPVIYCQKEIDAASVDFFRFADQYRTRGAEWENMLGCAWAEKKRVVLWGAGAKGAMFLNRIRNASGIEYIVDVNPHKHGLFIPGTGQQVMSPEFLKQYQPDAVLIMNPNYQDEIRGQIASLGLAPQLLCI